MLHALHNFGYIGLILTIFGEIGCMLFFLPGDTLIFGSGLLIHRGIYSYLPVVLTIFLTSAIAGEFAYHWSKKVGKDFLMNNKYYKIKQSDFDYTRDFFLKYGVFAITFSRFFPVIRNLISPICGVLEYDRKKFFIYNILASVLWPLVTVTFGFYFGRYFPNLIRYIEIIMLVGILAGATPFLLNVFKKKLKKKN